MQMKNNQPAEGESTDAHDLEVVDRAFDGRLYISHRECARLLEMSPETLNAEGDEGRIRFSVKGKRSRRYRRADVLAYIEGASEWHQPNQEKRLVRAAIKSATKRR